MGGNIYVQNFKIRTRLYSGRILLFTFLVCFFTVVLRRHRHALNLIRSEYHNHVRQPGNLNVAELDNALPPPAIHDANHKPGIPSDECYYIQAHSCSQTGWVISSEGRGIHVGDKSPMRVSILKPGLWGYQTMSLLLCNEDGTKTTQYVHHDGCEITVDEFQDDIFFKQSASFIQHLGRYYNGFFALESADFLGHYVISKGGQLSLEPEDSSSNFRADASWVSDTDINVKSIEGRPSVYFLNQPLPAGTDVPFVITDDTTCSRDHHGCCDMEETEFMTPTKSELGPADPATGDVAAIIISSSRTYPKRKALLDGWLLGPIQSGYTAPWDRAIISLDCFTDAIDPSLKKTDWVVGPLGAGPVGIPTITVRVPIVTHWTFERYPDASWYFTIDDDTLVFSENVIWALSYLEYPHEKLWYVGHSTEWKIKIWFHGKMAFGGGGILISNKGRKQWMDYWQGGVQNASKAWLESGKCSHDGGDGTVCRCLLLATGQKEMFTDFRGFHQFDIVGTAAMLEIIKDTCPNCPPVYEQAGLWIDDIVSQHTLLTFHHLLAIQPGAIYPGLDGTETGTMFYDAYRAYPNHLLMKRRCGYADNATYTLCINFGHQIQVFKGSVNPSDAFVLLDAKDGTSRARPTENLIYLAVRTHISEALLCSMHYQGNGTKEETIYKGTDIEPRSPRDPPCEGRATVQMHAQKFVAEIRYKKETLIWRQSTL
eukprot:TRINITY_DN4104_c0_g2_i1.p1 TRINITY_DN4104_c0_g2~~TRINITY_DN4104_c0_g2_i1.p1  ORF type:complete len:723 (+),score=175.26 TRINITY_DN4104_c0_g2_i1:34-2169(+)